MKKEQNGGGGFSLNNSQMKMINNVTKALICAKEMAT